MLRAFLLSVALMTMTVSSHANANPFVEFAKNHVHERGLTQCDAAVESMFEHAGGDDMRINSDTFNQNDAIHVTATWGEKGDAVLKSGTIIPDGNECLVFSQTQLTTNKSCTAYLNEQKAFDYGAESPDYIWAINEGGVDMLLTPSPGQGCVVYYNLNTVH